MKDHIVGRLTNMILFQYSEFLCPGNGKTGMGITRGTVMDKVSDEKDKDKDNDNTSMEIIWGKDKDKMSMGITQGPVIDKVGQWSMSLQTTN